MKKIVSLLVAMLLICTAAYAESPDLAAMSLEELKALHEQLDAELVARNAGAHSLITEGMYTAGKSIKPGAYKITCTEVYGEEDFTIHTFENEDNYSLYELGMGYGYGGSYDSLMNAYLVYSGNIEVGKSITVQLTEGMVLHIEGGSGEINALIADWAM